MPAQRVPPDESAHPGPNGPGWRRGAVGSAEIWDEATRSAHRKNPPAAPGGHGQQTAPRVRRRSIRRRPQATPPPSTPVPPRKAPQPSALAADQGVLLFHLRASVPELDRHPALLPALEALVVRALRTSARTGVSPDLARLRRRAEKLIKALRSMRNEMKRVSGLETVEQGISSIYRTVQGLAPDSHRAEAKREMLEDIFRANLDLRREAS